MRRSGSPDRAASIRGLYAIADDDPRWERSPVSQARGALAGGASVIQLRAKHATDAQALAWGRVIRSLADARGALFLVNDRFDLALAAGADGVHLGQTDLPPGRLPGAARERLLVGRSTHNLAELRRALDEPIDYVAFGPVFATRSKRAARAPAGLGRLAEAVQLAGSLPLVAIGGLTRVSVMEVVRAGARAAAVIEAIAGAEHAEQAARALVQRIAEATAAAPWRPPVVRSEEQSPKTPFCKEPESNH